MLFDGKGIQLELDQNGICHFIFNIKEGSANIIGRVMLNDLPVAIETLYKTKNIKGLIYESKKEHFIFGADITEFQGHFKKSNEELITWLSGINDLMNKLEDLPFPTVAAINGFALGGGLELCLTADFRVMGDKTKIGLPETKLGIIPGWGGTVRLPRIIGADNAIEWITSGNQYKADVSLKLGVVDSVVPENEVKEKALLLLNKVMSGELNYKERRDIKKSPLTLSPTEAVMCFETSKAYVAGIAGKNYPAPVMAIEVMQKNSTYKRDEALPFETKAFATLAHTEVANSLVQVFLNDQYLKKTSKKWTKEAAEINKAAVLGAGIMGGGIAYQSASKGTPILMKDINDHALELGMGEATKLLSKQNQRGKITPEKMAQTISKITPTLSYGDFKEANVVVEAVVENIKIKKAVLSEVEEKVADDTILASNTSTISITELSSALKRPENFCGMHFFNPVPKMPLVEVIRGSKTSDAAISKTVKYAVNMGKTPIVVNDCAGFLVNRVLFPYFNAFIKLVEDGVDYKRIDKVMEKFGWPMGPAYLLDVVGIDTGAHASNIIGDAYPETMKMGDKTIIEILHENNRLGQKNKIGFYKYEFDKKGRLKKSVDDSVDALISKVVKKTIEISDEDIVERMMLPMIIECSRVLEDKIVETPNEVDMGLMLGLGFPPFRAGALKYADSLGLKNIVNSTEKYKTVGNMYRPTKTMLEMAENNQKFYKEV